MSILRSRISKNICSKFTLCHSPTGADKLASDRPIEAATATPVITLVVVTRLLSTIHSLSQLALPSHSSMSTISIFSHKLGLPLVGDVHSQQCSIPQDSVQPSPLTKLLSSHSNSPNMMPSPQISVQVSSEVTVPPVHVQPSSTSHKSLHPSSSFKLLSSHCSPMSLCPLAQVLNTTNYC